MQSKFIKEIWQSRFTVHPRSPPLYITVDGFLQANRDHFNHLNNFNRLIANLSTYPVLDRNKQGSPFSF